MIRIRHLPPTLSKRTLRFSKRLITTPTIVQPNNGNLERPKPKRIDYIDSAKGICILMVVLFHCGIIDSDIPCLGMLRMPFYFTLSGLFFKDYGGFLPTLIKKINRLFIPFLFFFTLSYLLFVTIRIFINGEIDIPYYCFITSKALINIALWFLLALFSVNIEFYLLHKLIKNMVLLGLSSILISYVILVLFDGKFFLPMYLDSGLAALPFFYFGFCLKRTGILYPNKYDTYNKLLIIILLTISYISFVVGESPYIGYGSLSWKGNLLCFYIGACSVVLAVLLICKEFKRIPGVQYIGKYSLIILGLHLLVNMFAIQGLKIVGITEGNFLFNILLFAFSMGISVICIPYFVKFFPKFTAQDDLIVYPLRWKR